MTTSPFGNGKPGTPRYLNSVLLPLAFLLLCVVFDWLYSCLSDEMLRYYFHNHFVAACVETINFLSPGENVAAVQNTLVSSNANLALVRTCDGSDSFFMIAAAILLFPASLKTKLWGLLTGLCVVMLLNFLRIVSLFFLMAYSENWFAPVHQNIAPVISIGVSCAFFAFWAYSARDTENGGSR